MKNLTFSIKLPEDLVKFANKRAKELTKARGYGKVSRNGYFRELLLADKKQSENGHP